MKQLTPSQPSSTTSRQLTSAETQKWDINDPKAQFIHTKLGEMIALDFQPFSIVSDVGFERFVHVLESRYCLPSRKYLTETVMEKVFAGVKR